MYSVVLFRQYSKTQTFPQTDVYIFKYCSRGSEILLKYGPENDYSDTCNIQNSFGSWNIPVVSSTFGGR